MATIKHIGGDGPAPFRVAIETADASVKMNLRLAEVQSLVEDGLEVLVERSNEEEPCPFCDAEEPGRCDLRQLLQSMLNELHR